MIFFELESTDITALSDGELRELVARLCEAELIQQGLPPSSVRWGGAQEAADGGLDVSVSGAQNLKMPNFVPRKKTGFQVKKHSMSKASCKKEMQENNEPKPIICELAAKNGAYIIVSGKDDCSEKMLLERLDAMKEALSSLENKDDLVVDFYGRDRLFNWLRCHPSVALWVRSRLGKPLAGWSPFGRWAATPLDQDDEFLVDDFPCVTDANSTMKEPISVSAGIQLTRDRLRKHGSAVRITGLSGVGKTRFAQALFEAGFGGEELPASDVIYADLGNDLSPTASELVTYLVANDFASYLVLDNCPPDVHRSLQKQVSQSGAKLHLLTIEYDISDDKPEETEVVHIEPTSEATVSRLIQRRFPELDRVNADRVATFSGGNARIALALASRVDVDETLSNFSDEDLFRRLFQQRKESAPDLLQGAEALALVYSFDTSLSGGDELSVLGDMVGLSRKDLYRNQAELLRRQLAQQRGSWRAILPHALANRLAKRALESISPEDINSELFKVGNIRLLQSCAHRLGYLHDFDPARELAHSWIQPGAPLHNIESCGEKLLVVLERVAPVFPEVILRSLERASEKPGFATRDNGSFNRLVQLLCNLAYEDSSFDQAARMLLKFAESENKGENNNSIVARFKQLFSLYLSGTEALPERRQAFVQSLVGSKNIRHREIARELLQSAFEATHWSSYAVFHFGARKRGSGWQPKTEGEKKLWYVGYIKLLMALLVSKDEGERVWAKSILAANFRGLWSFAGCFDVLEEVVRAHGQSGQWPEMWMSIKKTLRFDAKRHSSELLERLESLERFATPVDPYSEIEAYALSNIWEHAEVHEGEYEEGEKKIREKVVGLGALAASNLEYLEHLGGRVWEERSESLWWFGQGLAQGSIDYLSLFDFLVDSLERYHSERVSLSLLLGYINAVHAADSHVARVMLERSLSNRVLKPYSVNLLSSVPMVPWVVHSLQRIAAEGELEAWRFECISYARVHEGISDDDLALLLTSVNALEKGFMSVIQILSMRFFGGRYEEVRSSRSLRAVGRASIKKFVSSHRDELRGLRSSSLDRVMDESFNEPDVCDEAKEIIEVLCEGVVSSRLYAFELDELIGALIKKYPEFFLDEVFVGRDRAISLARLLFRDSGGSRGATLNATPIDRILTWCAGDQERIEQVASAVQSYSVDTTGSPSESPKRTIISEHSKALLTAALDKKPIVEIICRDSFPDSWSGSLAEILDRRAEAFAELLSHSSEEVRACAKASMLTLKQNIEVERDREAKRDNEREQRFE